MNFPASSNFEATREEGASASRASEEEGRIVRARGREGDLVNRRKGVQPEQSRRGGKSGRFLESVNSLALYLACPSCLPPPTVRSLLLSPPR